MCSGRHKYNDLMNNTCLLYIFAFMFTHCECNLNFLFSQYSLNKFQVTHSRTSKVKIIMGGVIVKANRL